VPYAAPDDDSRGQPAQGEHHHKEKKIMLKSEYARQQLRRRLEGAGQVKIEDLIGEADALTDDGDPRWIGGAVSHFDGTGQLRHVSCSPNHHHDAGCAVEWMPAP
jgi:hypothetical protein